MESFSGKKALVTGINGFVGTHLARTLMEKGMEVHGLVRDAKNIPYLDGANLPEKPHLHVGDIRDADAVRKAVSAHEYSHVFHLASQSNTWKSAENPRETFEINTLGTLNLLEAIRQTNHTPSFIMGGSVRVFHYTAKPGQIGKEEGMHAYDASKAMAEMMVSSYFQTYGMNGAIARNTNLYGGNDLNFFRLIPTIMKGVLVDHAIKLWGKGQVKRDFLYVRDAVDGMVLLGEKAENKSIRGNAFTFASGETSSVNDICSMVKDISPVPFSIEWSEKNNVSDRDQEALDVSHTQEVLGWAPHTSMKDGLQKTMQWYHDYFSKKEEAK